MKLSMSPHQDEAGKVFMAVEGVTSVQMSCNEIILYKQSLEIHLCVLSLSVLSEAVSEQLQ